MSERDEELELQALQRELDDALATTRPRVGFEDELWTRMQSKRPLSTRVRDAFAGLLQGIREVPRVAAAAIAGILLVILSVGILSNGLRGGGGAGSSTSAQFGGNVDRSTGAAAPAGFGLLPAPPFNSSSGGLPGETSVQALATTPYYGPVKLVWGGQSEPTIMTAPVFRYPEPSTTAADQFASALGAAAQFPKAGPRPTGMLGDYATTTYRVEVFGTGRSGGPGPIYVVFPFPEMPPIAAAGASPADLASLFLAEHSLTPTWPYSVSVASSGSMSTVEFQRQFDVPDYGLAFLVDPNGDRTGLRADFNGNSLQKLAGMLPVSVDVATYRLVPADQAIQSAIAVGASGTSAPRAPVPTATLTSAELVYVVAPGGDHSFYEPAYLFTGKFQVNGTTYTKRVLVPAVDPSQRVP